MHCTEYRSDNLLFEEQLHISREWKWWSSITVNNKTFAMAAPGAQQGHSEPFNLSIYFLLLFNLIQIFREPSPEDDGEEENKTKTST